MKVFVLLAVVLLVCFIHRSKSNHVTSLCKNGGEYTLWSYKAKVKNLNSLVSDIIPKCKAYDSYGAALASSKLDEYTVQVDSNSIEYINNNLENLIKKIFSTSDVTCIGKDRLVVNKKGCVVSLHSWPIGWYNYPYLLSVTSLSNTVSIDIKTPNTTPFTSISSKINMPKRSHIQVIFKHKTIKNEHFISVVVNVTSVGVSEKHVLTIKKLIESHFQKGLHDQLHILESRKKMIDSYQEDRLKIDRETKKKDLDQIINPAKYRSNRINNRARGSASGSSTGKGGGRYTPSAATKARREVKRSGG